MFLLCVISLARASDAGLTLHVVLADGTKLPLIGAVHFEDGMPRVSRPGGDGAALLTDLVGPLSAQGWTSAGGMPAPGVKPGVSEHAVSTVWRRGVDRLGIELFDAGFGQETVALLRTGLPGVAGAPLEASWEVAVPGGPTLAFDTDAMDFDDHGFAVTLDDAEGWKSTWDTSLAAAGWKAGTGDWWVRGQDKLRVEARSGGRAEVAFDDGLPSGWANLELPLDAAMVTERAPNELEVRVAETAALSGWLASADARLRKAGWTTAPVAIGRAYDRGDVRLYMQTPQTTSDPHAAPTTPYVRLRAAWRDASPAGPSVLLQLPDGGHVALPARLSGEAGADLTVWDWRIDPEGSPLFDSIRGSLLELGWQAQPGDARGLTGFVKESERIALGRASIVADFLGREKEGVTILRTPAPPQAPGVRGVRAPRPAPAAVPPTAQEFDLTLVLPGAKLSAVTPDVFGDGNGVCVGTGSPSAPTLVSWQSALRAGGWTEGKATWLERQGRSARLRQEDGYMCAELDAEVHPTWSELGFPLEGAFVSSSDERELRATYRDVGTADAAADAVFRGLIAKGWTAQPDGTMSRGSRAVSKADVLIAIERPSGPAELILTRLGPEDPVLR